MDMAANRKLETPLRPPSSPTSWGHLCPQNNARKRNTLAVRQRQASPGRSVVFRRATCFRHPFLPRKSTPILPQRGDRTDLRWGPCPAPRHGRVPCPVARGHSSARLVPRVLGQPRPPARLSFCVPLPPGARARPLPLPLAPAGYLPRPSLPQRSPSLRRLCRLGGHGGRALSPQYEPQLRGSSAPPDPLPQ